MAIKALKNQVKLMTTIIVSMCVESTWEFQLKLRVCMAEPYSIIFVPGLTLVKKRKSPFKEKLSHQSEKMTNGKTEVAFPELDALLEDSPEISLIDLENIFQGRLKSFKLK